jgi:putative tryptophan/tyrosine transport system substrate-binding protein
VKLERRSFLGLFGIGLVIGPSRSLAQIAGSVPKIGVLLGLANDAEAHARVKAFEEELEKEGWRPGRDVVIEYRYAAGDAERIQAFAKELVTLNPAVIVGHSTPVVAQIAKATRDIPIVFVVVADPVGAGFAASIARPGGNVTGFTNLDPSITGKLVMMLRELVPKIGSAGLMFNPRTVTSGGSYQVYVEAFESAAASLGIEATVLHVHDPNEIERAITALSQKSGPALVVMPDNFNTINRDLIISFANKSRVPAIYPYRYFVEAGGLMSYGVDVKDLFRRAPQYVSRILRGADPGTLPIQAPTKFELAINLKTAGALGIPVPKLFLASADMLVE